jgi:hypothetical protein
VPQGYGCAELPPRYAKARVGAPRPGGARKRFQDFLFANSLRSPRTEALGLKGSSSTKKQTFCLTLRRTNGKVPIDLQVEVCPGGWSLKKESY